MRRTKIICTLGPSIADPKKLERAIRLGADVIRLNFSHSTFEQHGRSIRLIRKLSSKLKRPVGILADLPGPKLRTGDLENGKPILLKRGAKTTLTTRAIEGTSEMIPVLFAKLPKFVRRGSRILLQDGNLELHVLKKTGKDIQCEVVAGGLLQEHQGINLPGRHLSIPAFTSRDKESVRFLAKNHVDFMALSFVQRASDIKKARNMMKRLGQSIPIIAKIEKPEALKHIDEILDASDGLMIARGDLGVEVPTADIPVVQKNLIHLANDNSVPVITATQMLESMMNKPRPTRAETTDVANAIWDGTDAVMLSGETASGDYPFEAISIMSDIILRAEENPKFSTMQAATTKGPLHARTVIEAVSLVSNPDSHKAIVTYTATGDTAKALSNFRPEIPILALTPSPSTYQRLSLLWGVRGFVSPQGRNVEEMIQAGDKMLVRKAGLHKGDHVIVVAGTHLTSGATNLMKVHQVGETLSGKSSKSL